MAEGGVMEDGVWPETEAGTPQGAGIRAGLCHDTYSAHQGVEHDNMNVLVLGSRVIGPELALDLVRIFLAPSARDPVYLDGFRDRVEAGRMLATHLGAYAHREDVMVLALPRGGVPVAAEVASRLNAPLDIFPGPEAGNAGTRGTGDWGDRERRNAYRGDRPPLDVAAKTVILVDHSLATGASMYAAITALRQKKPAKIVVAVPAAAAQTCEALSRIADEVICSETPESFQAVSLWYDDFLQVTGEEVRGLLNSFRHEATSAGDRPRW
ncbi:MAG: RpiB/LacA/LacB family sugar-phosphate isomerase [Bryobacteraceae bacterium]